MSPQSDEVILASQSVIRAQILRNAGVSVEVAPARIDEGAIKAAMLAENAPPRDIASTLADLKAQKIASLNPNRIVIAADQVLSFQDRIFDKPPNMDDAKSQLQVLRGQQHHLLSAVVIYRDQDCLLRDVDTVKLTMRAFDDGFLDQYLAAVGETVLTSVGGYQLEALGAQLFEKVDGDYFSVLGLPLFAVLNTLRLHGYLAS